MNLELWHLSLQGMDNGYSADRAIYVAGINIFIVISVLTVLAKLLISDPLEKARNEDLMRTYRIWVFSIPLYKPENAVLKL